MQLLLTFVKKTLTHCFQPVLATSSIRARMLEVANTARVTQGHFGRSNLVDLPCTDAYRL